MIRLKQARQASICSAVILMAVVLVAGCASSTVGRYHTVQQEAATSGFAELRFGAAPPVVGMLRTPQNDGRLPHTTSSVLWVMIEGDGRAWLNMREPSQDPTPVDAVGWRLAQNISRRNVLYLARPCQFLSSAELQACSIDDWTGARFSEKWVTRLNVAIDEARHTTHADRIAIAGYSGGGVMASLIAARRNDVALLVTVAAPLDHAAWTVYHQVSPLTGSLDVLSVREKLMRLPQMHVTGADDQVVPTLLLKDFLRVYPNDAPAELVTLPGVDHRMRPVIDISRIRSSRLLSQSIDDLDIYP
ncbi:alpha/beta hydrolase family protein [Herminiimonas aquatilis]|uniref:Alpha/beta hydrolase family protein n=1 Tax=Herminiimonas aquatilis TaxID=345342 RepID=A0ABW2J8P4_9BURK